MRHQYLIRIEDKHGNTLAQETGSRFESTVGYLYQKHKIGRGRFVAITDWLEREDEWPIGLHKVQMGRNRRRIKNPVLDEAVYVRVSYAGWRRGNDEEAKGKRGKDGRIRRYQMVVEGDHR